VADVGLHDRFRNHPPLGFVDWVLRGIGQVVFQNTPISGAVILGGIFYNLWIYSTVCLLGAIIRPNTTGNSSDMMRRIDLDLIPRKFVSIALDHTPQVSMRSITAVTALARSFCCSVASAAAILTAGSSEARLSSAVDSSIV
jgi:hypothetical protein